MSLSHRLLSSKCGNMTVPQQHCRVMTWYQGSLGSFPMKLLKAESGPDGEQIKICPPPKLISQACVSAVSELLQELPVGHNLVSRRSWGLSSSCWVTACLKSCKKKSIFRGQKYLINGKTSATSERTAVTLDSERWWIAAIRWSDGWLMRVNHWRWSSIKHLWIFMRPVVRNLFLRPISAVIFHY